MKDLPSGLAFRDEDQIDDYLAKANEQAKTEEDTDTSPKTEEDIVEQKAIEGPKLATTVRQKRLQLSEKEIENRINQIVTKYPQIDEVALREAIALRLEEKGRVTEADIIDIQNHALKIFQKQEQEQEGTSIPVVSPPPLVANSLDVAKEQAGKAADWASSLKTPGGIGFLLFVLFFFIWVIVPVSNGKTRLQLLWGVLTGQVQFRSDVISEEENAIQTAVNSSQSASSNGTGSGGVSVLVPFSIDFGDDYGMG